MNEFKCALKYVLLFQLFIWFFYLIAFDFTLLLGLVAQIVVSCFYINNYKDVIQTNNLKKTNFNVFLIILWLIFTYIFAMFSVSIIGCSGGGYEVMIISFCWLRVSCQCVINKVVELVLVILKRNK